MPITVAQLEGYRGVCSELDGINGELARLKVQDCVQSASTPPYSKHSVTVSGLPPDPQVISLLKRKSILEHSHAEIKRFVESVEDSEVRRIILMRYIWGKRKPSWQNVAMRLGYCSEHTPQRKIKKYFSKGGNGGI